MNVIIITSQGKKNYIYDALLFLFFKLIIDVIYQHIADRMKLGSINFFSTSR